MIKDVKKVTVKYNERIVGYLAEIEPSIIGFQYDDEWIKKGFSISPLSLPLDNKVYKSKKELFNGLYGVFWDSLPDGWGELLMNRILTKNGINPNKLSILTKLSLINKNGLGGLTYEPTQSFQFKQDNLDFDKLSNEVQKILNDESETVDLDFVYGLGGSSGGARPKAHIMIDNEEWIVKGYEYEEGKYVIFEDKDFEKIKSKKDKNITIEKFVDVIDVDPLYFDKPYYVVPTGAEKAYSVLLTAMEEENKAAIAKTVLGEKETLIMIRAKNGQMLLNTLFFEEEVQKNPSKEIKDSGNAQELKMAKAIIESMSGEFKPEEYKDEYIEKVKNAIERKIAGKEIVSPKEGKETKIIDLMEALKKSLTQVQRPKTNRTTKTKLSVKKAQ